MASTKSLRTKFKRFFSSNGGSDEGLEIVQKFLLPFTRALPKWSMSIDDVLKAFFALDNREFFYVRAKRKFRLPGNLLIAGNRVSPGEFAKPTIEKGQVLLLALDRIEGTARVAFFKDEKEMNYRLFRFEIEAIKDLLEVIDDKGNGDRHRDYSDARGTNRNRPMEREPRTGRNIRRGKVSK